MPSDVPSSDAADATAMGTDTLLVEAAVDAGADVPHEIVADSGPTRIETVVRVHYPAG